MTNKSYELLIHEGRKAVKDETDAKWRLGDLAIQVEPSTKGSEKLKEYADAIGVDFNSLVTYRRVAERWPVEKRLMEPGDKGASWTVHAELVNAQHLLRPGLKLREARKLLGRAQPGGAEPRVEGSNDVEIAQRVMANPTLAAQVLSDRSARVGAGRAAEAVDRGQREAARRTVFRGNEEAMAADAKATDVLEASRLLGHARQDLRQALDRLNGLSSALTASEKELIASDAEDVALTLGWINTWLSEGTVTDEALAALLGGEQA